jgi:hypothetical protein
MQAIEIKSAGGWGRILLTDGHQRWRFFQPSSFTGSFYFGMVGAFCESGLFLVQDCGDNTAPYLTLAWKEYQGAVIEESEPSVLIYPWNPELLAA